MAFAFQACLNISSSVHGSIPSLAELDSGAPIKPLRNRKSALAVALLLAGLGGLAIAYRLRASPFAWSVFVDAFRGVRWFWLILSILFIFLSYLGRAIRWEIMLRPLRQDPGSARGAIARLFVSTLIGFAAVVLLGRAGELVRPYLIAVKERVSFSSQMAAWLLERIFDLLMVLLLFGFALAAVPADKLHLGPGLRWVFQTGGWVCAGICALCITLLAGFRRFSDTAGERLTAALGFLPEGARKRAVGIASAFAEGMRTTASTNFLTLILAYSALEWAILIGSNFCLFRSFPVTAAFTLTQVTVFMGLASFGAAVQIPGIGGGFQVVAILVLTEIFGLRLETASGLAILIWVTGYLPVVPVGLALAFKEGIKWNALKKIREDMKV